MQLTSNEIEWEEGAKWAAVRNGDNVVMTQSSRRPPLYKESDYYRVERDIVNDINACLTAQKDIQRHEDENTVCM